MLRLKNILLLGLVVFIVVSFLASPMPTGEIDWSFENLLNEVPIKETVVSSLTMTLRPDGDGNLVQLVDFPAAGDDWEDIDEATHDGDSTYVYTSQGYQFVTLEDSGGTYGAISNVRVCVYVKHMNDVTYLPKIQMLTYLSGTTEYPGLYELTDTTYTLHYYDFATDPSGGAWSWADIDALEVGLQATKLPFPFYQHTTRMTQIYAIVTYVNTRPEIDNSPLCTNLDDGDNLYARYKLYEVPVSATDVDGFDDIDYVELRSYDTESQATLRWTVRFNQTSGVFSEEVGASYIELTGSTNISSGADLDIIFKFYVEWAHGDWNDEDFYAYVIDKSAEDGWRLHNTNYDFDTDLTTTFVLSDGSGTVDRGNYDSIDSITASGTVSYEDSGGNNYPPDAAVDMFIRCADVAGSDWSDVTPVSGVWSMTVDSDDVVGEDTYYVKAVLAGGNYDSATLLGATTSDTYRADVVEIYMFNSTDYRDDVGTTLELRVKARLAYDDEALGAGDTVTLNGSLSMTWDASGWFDYNPAAYSYVTGLVYNITASTEATRGVTKWRWCNGLNPASNGNYLLTNVADPWKLQTFTLEMWYMSEDLSDFDTNGGINTGQAGWRTYSSAANGGYLIPYRNQNDPNNLLRFYNIYTTTTGYTSTYKQYTFFQEWTWYHLVYSVNSTGYVWVYVDGELQDGWQAANFVAWRYVAPTNGYIAGSWGDESLTHVDEVRYYNISYTAEQAHRAYYGEHSTTGLVSYWPMDGDFDDAWGSYDCTVAGTGDPIGVGRPQKLVWDAMMVDMWVNDGRDDIGDTITVYANFTYAWDGHLADVSSVTFNGTAASEISSNYWSLGRSSNYVRSLVYAVDGFTDDSFGLATKGWWHVDTSTSEYVNVPDHTDLKPAILTVATWIRLTDSSALRHLWCTKWNGWSCELSTTHRPWFRIAGAGDSPYGDALIVGDWYHYVGVYNPNGDAEFQGNSLFINGVRVGTTYLTNAITHSTNPLTIGKYAGGLPFGGNVRDVRIYNRALTAAEIFLLYCGQEPSSSGLVLHLTPNSWDIEDDTWYDMSGLGHDGTIYGNEHEASTDDPEFVKPVWDAIGINMWIGDGRDNIDDTITVYAWLTYMYDVMNVTDGTVLLNGTGMSYASSIWSLGRSQATVGLWAYNITSLSGNTYGITVVGWNEFDGADETDYMEASHSASLNITASITVSAWIYIDSYMVDQVAYYILSKGSDGWGSYHIRLWNNTNLVGFGIGDPASKWGVDYVVLTQVLSTGEWHYITGTWDQSGDLLSIYWNGVLNNTDATTYTTIFGANSTVLTVGALKNHYYYFNGSIDSIRIYNRSLGAAEVFETYQGRYSDDTGLVFHVNMASYDVVDDIWYDLSGEGNDLTIYGPVVSARATYHPDDDSIYVRPIWDQIKILGYSTNSTDNRDNIGTYVNITVWIQYDYDDTNVTDGTIVINGDSYAYNAGSGNWTAIFSNATYSYATWNTVVVSGNTYGITNVNQNSKSQLYVWDEIEVYWSDTTDNRTNYNEVEKPAFKLRLKYDGGGTHYLTDGTNDGVNINGSEATWIADAFNYWYKNYNYAAVVNYTFWVTSASEDTYGITSFDTSSATAYMKWIVWDRAIVMGYTTNSTDNRDNINDCFNVSVWIQYEYDSTNITDGTIVINGDAFAYNSGSGNWTALFSNATASGVTWDTIVASGNTYGITYENQNGKSQEVIWDSYTVDFTVGDNRININVNATVSYTVISDYDAIAYDGTVNLNYTTWECSSVQRQGFTVSSLSGDDTYGITAIKTNDDDYVIWDAIGVNMWISDGRDDIGDNVTVYVWLTYLWDNTNLTDGTVELNGSAMAYAASIWSLNVSQATVGLWAYNVTTITGNSYGISVIADAYSYGDNSDYMEVAGGLDGLANATGCTFAFWILTDWDRITGDAAYQVLMGQGSDWDHAIFLSVTADNLIEIDLRYADGTDDRYNARMNMSGFIGKWTHVAFVFNGTAQKMHGYVNGVLREDLYHTPEDDAAKTILPDVTGDDFRIYRNPFGTNYFCDSQLGEVQIFNRSLGAREVFELYQGRFSNNTDLIFNVHMSSVDVEDSTWYDMSTSKNNVTFSGQMFNATSDYLYTRLIWDRWNVTIIADDIDVLCTTVVNFTMVIQYDYDNVNLSAYELSIYRNSTSWYWFTDGNYTLFNDTHSTPSLYNYTVYEVSADEWYALTSVLTNLINVTWCNNPSGLGGTDPTLTNPTDGDNMYAKLKDYIIVINVTDADGYDNVLSIWLFLWNDTRADNHWTILFNITSGTVSIVNGSAYIDIVATNVSSGNWHNITLWIKIDWDHSDQTDVDTKVVITDDFGGLEDVWDEVNWDVETRLDYSIAPNVAFAPDDTRGDRNSAAAFEGTVIYYGSGDDHPLANETDVWLFHDQDGVVDSGNVAAGAFSIAFTTDTEIRTSTYNCTVVIQGAGSGGTDLYFTSPAPTDTFISDAVQIVMTINGTWTLSGYYLNVSFNGTYQFDAAVWNGDATIANTSMTVAVDVHWEAVTQTYGNWTFYGTAVDDDVNYGLTEFNTTTVWAIWDEILLSAPPGYNWEIDSDANRSWIIFHMGTAYYRFNNTVIPAGTFAYSYANSTLYDWGLLDATSQVPTLWIGPFVSTDSIIDVAITLTPIVGGFTYNFTIHEGVYAVEAFNEIEPDIPTWDTETLWDIVGFLNNDEGEAHTLILYVYSYTTLDGMPGSKIQSPAPAGLPIRVQVEHIAWDGAFYCPNSTWYFFGVTDDSGKIYWQFNQTMVDTISVGGFRAYSGYINVFADEPTGGWVWINSMSVLKSVAEYVFANVVPVNENMLKLSVTQALLGPGFATRNFDSALIRDEVPNSAGGLVMDSLYEVFRVDFVDPDGSTWTWQGKAILNETTLVYTAYIPGRLFGITNASLTIIQGLMDNQVRYMGDLAGGGPATTQTHPYWSITERMLQMNENYIMFTGVTDDGFNATLYVNNTIWGTFGNWSATSLTDMINGTFSLMWDRNRTIGGAYTANYSILVQRWGQYYDGYDDIESGDTWTFWHNETMWLNGTYESVQIDDIIDDDLSFMFAALNPCGMEVGGINATESEKEIVVNATLVEIEEVKDEETYEAVVYREPVLLSFLKVDPCGTTVLNIGLVYLVMKGDMYEKRKYGDSDICIIAHDEWNNV